MTSVDRQVFIHPRVQHVTVGKGAPLKIGNGLVILPTLYNGCNYLYMIGF